MLADRSTAAAGGPPLVSVVVPCFNSAPFVAEAIESVFAQTYPRVEVIAVDDCSTDGTVSVLRRFEPGVQVMRLRRNCGPSVARNRGLEIASGEFVQFLDADDVLHPKKIATCMAAFEPDVDLVFSRIRYFLDGPAERRVWAGDGLGARALRLFRRRLTTWDPGRAAEYVLRREVGTPAPLHRASALRRWGGFREDLWSLEDIELLFRLAASGARMRMVDAALVHCRHHGSPSRLRARQGRFLVSLAALDAMHEIVAAQPQSPPGVSAALGDRYAKVARNLLREGHGPEAARAFALAKQLTPSPAPTGFPVYNLVTRALGLRFTEELRIAFTRSFGVQRRAARPYQGSAVRIRGPLEPHRRTKAAGLGG